MPKKSGLVCQHLEHINVRALEQYQQIIHAYVRQQEGVYALYRKGRLYYVGLASDLKWRLGAHLKDRHKQQWDSFSVYLTANDQHLKELESLLLRVVLPGLLAGYGNSLQLRSVYKGKAYRAFLLKDGTIRYKNRKYMSPSSAGKAVVQRACNGWAFWRYQQAPGQWVRLSTLRSG